MVLQKKREREKEILVYICSETKKLDWILIINLGIYLWELVEVFSTNN